LITTVCHNGSPRPGRACVHRARFLEELIKLIPPSTALFNKNLTAISKINSTGELALQFADGTSATASAVIACDGIKSVARQQYVLSDIIDPKISRPVFANEFAYRGMFPRSQFLKITGNSINVGKGTIFCGPDSYTVMYPVEKGSLMNMVAVKRIPPPVPGSEFAVLQHDSNWIQSVTNETMLSDFSSWGAPIKALLSNIQRPERWALYDHVAAPTYVKGRVALMGDAAHATTPHQGQGAGMAFEDSLILSGILGNILNYPCQEEESELDMHKIIESCLLAYDEVRRPRTQEVTRTSKEMGGIIGYSGEGIGRDLAKMKLNLDSRMAWIWDIDLDKEVKRGVEIARTTLNNLS
jgi:salicylate hydroxylase